jgi:hypothetical protein
MRGTNAGKGRAKAFISLLVLFFIGYAGIKVIPVWLNNYELQNYLQEQTPFWLTQHASSDAVRGRVLAKAQDLNLPISKEEVQVEASEAKVVVTIDYTVPIDLKVYTWTLHLNAHSENRAL